MRRRFLSSGVFSRCVRIFLALAVLASPSAVLAGDELVEGGRWRGPDGEFLPFAEDEEILDFLRRAEVTSTKEISGGINRPLKVGLRAAVGDSTVTANAIFRTVDRRKDRHVETNKVYLDFHDSHIYECAAYELARLLSIDQVPPCVRRVIDGRSGTLQLWVENAMTEEKRREKGLEAQSSLLWVRQQHTLRLFDALIYNYDRNQGNMLVDEDWKLWFIDHTRSFHIEPRIVDLERIVWVERGVFERLRALDRETLEERLGGMVEKPRLAAVLKRRDLLVEHLEARIAERGEGAVVYEGHCGEK